MGRWGDLLALWLSKTSLMYVRFLGVYWYIPSCSDIPIFFYLWSFHTLWELRPVSDFTQGAPKVLNPYPIIVGFLKNFKHVPSSWHSKMLWVHLVNCCPHSNIIHFFSELLFLLLEHKNQGVDNKYVHSYLDIVSRLPQSKKKKKKIIY